jgi:predicted nucleotide-binding protein
MAKKFTGSYEDLQALLSKAGLRGEWSEDQPGKYTFRGEDGCVLNYWRSMGSVQFQGGGRLKELAGLFESAALDERMAEVGRTREDRRQRQIFIVHGHDAVSRDQLELALRRLGLEPFVLMNSSGGGNTLIEALEGAIGRDYSSDFGIVLMTPDDMGCEEGRRGQG